MRRLSANWRWTLSAVFGTVLASAAPSVAQQPVDKAEKSSPTATVKADECPSPVPALVGQVNPSAPTAVATGEAPAIMTPWLARSNRVEAAAAVGLRPSSQKFYDNIIDRQYAAPRPNNAMLDVPRTGITFLFGGATSFATTANGNYSPLTAPIVADAGTIAFFVNAQASSRADAVVDSTRLPDPGKFLPSTIPVRGEPYYQSGERSTILSPDVGTIVKLDARAGTDVTSGRLYTEFDYFTLTNGDSGVRLRFLYGQFGNVIAGKAPSSFDDPDSIMDTIDPTGPNARLILGHPLIGYIVPIRVSDQSSTYAAVSIETPEADVTPINPDEPNKSNSYSHVPDFAAKLRWQDNQWGHIQLSALLRDIGIEDDANILRQDVLGWGVRLSGSLTPFPQRCGCPDDTIFFAAAHGEGIGAYVVDLNGNGLDAVLDATNQLKALPVTAYYTGFTHYWSRKLRSSIGYSEVDLDSIAIPVDPNESIYHRGRYGVVNTVYQWNVQMPGDSDPKKNVHTAFTGIEYLFGQKEALSGASGEAHRVVCTLGLKY